MDTKALRQKILDLAIRGKLVPQDPSDEPASVLLERIREQKKQMVKEGKLKAKDIKNDTIIFVGEDNLHYEKFQDGSVKCIEDEIPFELPEGWAWCRLNSIVDVRDGTHDTPTYVDKGIPLITSKNLVEGGIDYSNVKYISEKDAISINERSGVNIGDILFAMIGTIGNPSMVTKDILISIKNVALFKFTFSKNLSNHFVMYFLDYAQEDMKNKPSGGLQPFVSLNFLRTYLVPVPPVEEQQRIVSILADSINKIRNIDVLKNELTASVKKAKSKILDLAIRGKLVPQDPNDEPASVLLERIRAEKEELINQGKIKRDKKESVIFKGDDNSYYGIHLPDSWNWASLREITLSISDGSHNPPPNNGSGIPLLSAANINDNSILMNEISRWITNEEWKIENQRTNIEVGDVLLTIVGSIGRSAVVQNNNHFALQRSVAVIKPCLINPLYLMHIVQSPQIQKWLTDNSKGTAQKGIYLNALSLMIIPIPPLAEQARIVEHIHIAYKQLDLISNALI